MASPLQFTPTISTLIQSNHELGSGLTQREAIGHEGIENLPAINDLSYYAMLSIEPCARNECHEELGAIGVGAGICHREITSSDTSIFDFAHPGIAREPEAFFEMPLPGADEDELGTRPWGLADGA